MGHYIRNNTDTIRRRYDRNAFIYDLMEWPVERMRFKGWRSRLTQKIKGPRALEAGVGTGKNMIYYPHRCLCDGHRLQPKDACQG